MAQLRELIGQLERGDVDPAAVRGFLNRMTIRQNNWTLGVYCLLLPHGHRPPQPRGHDVFPHLKQREPGLTPVIDRLSEHEVIADLLEAIDQALNGLAADAT